MKTENVINDNVIFEGLEKTGFDQHSVGEGRLMLLELLVKAGAGSYNSHTEERFLSWCLMLKKDRTPNKRGREFIVSMVYASSNKRPTCFNLMKCHRSQTSI